MIQLNLVRILKSRFLLEVKQLRVFCMIGVFLLRFNLMVRCKNLNKLRLMLILQSTFKNFRSAVALSKLQNSG